MTEYKNHWADIDALEKELMSVNLPKRQRGGMRLRTLFGNTVGQIVITAISIIWIIPLFYLIVQSFRGESGAWSPTFFPKTWTLDNYKRLFTETKFL